MTATRLDPTEAERRTSAHPPASRVAWTPAAGVGLLAAGAALGTAELLSGLFAEVPSLVVGIADVFIQETPGGIVRWSIRTFGKTQKPLLVTGIVVTALLLGAVLGIVARRRPSLGIVGFVAFGAVGAWAAARSPLYSLPWAALAAGASALVGASSLVLLERLIGDARVSPDRLPAAPTGGTAHRTRRAVLLGAVAAAVWGVGGAALGRALRGRHNVEGARAALATRFGDGASGTAAPPLPAGTALDAAVSGISPLVTPNDDFYRIDTAIIVPQVDPGEWRLRVTGMVDQPVELTFDELLALPAVEQHVTIQCVSNQVGGDLVGNARWLGVPLAAVLALAGVQDGATQIVGRSVDGWTGGFPTAIALDGRASMIAVAMNGEPLPVEHGFPARLIIPGLYGYVSATKWLTELELTTMDAVDGYWITRGWAKDGPIKTQARIDVPRSGAPIAAGATQIAGVAWAPTRGIERVEVRVEDGPWEPAQLSVPLSDDTWVQWVLDWDAAPGAHRISVRATDGDGQTQTADVAPPAPSGATGYHTIRVEVR